MIGEIVYRYPEEKEKFWKKIEKHYRLFDRKLLSDVQKIFTDVETHGDKAVIQATEKFDNINIKNTPFFPRPIT